MHAGGRQPCDVEVEVGHPNRCPTVASMIASTRGSIDDMASHPVEVRRLVL
jgi:hypothetical protein